jgi:rhomboid protease GluP
MPAEAVSAPAPSRAALAGPEPVDLAAWLASRPAQAPMTTALVLLNLLIFGLMLGFGAELWRTSTTVPLAWGANFAPATQDGQWWRLATAMFVHFGLLHLGLNMLALWDVGRLVERLFGRPRYVLLYLGSGLAGNLLSLVVQGNHAVSGGASGAIFGLYGALLVTLLRERRQVEHREFKRLFGAVLLFTLLTLGIGQVLTGIDNAAHLGGLFGGALLGSLLAMPLTARSPASRRWLAALGLGLAVTWLLLRLPEPRYLMRQELQAQESIRQFQRLDQQTAQKMAVILLTGRQKKLSVDDLAKRINSQVSRAYWHGFEQLTALQTPATLPSAQALTHLQAYALSRAEAAYQLTLELRSHDAGRINRALQKWQPGPPVSAKSAAMTVFAASRALAASAAEGPTQPQAGRIDLRPTP